MLLVGRIYICKNKHQILSHDPCVLSQIKHDFPQPFVLFHKTGVTRQLFQSLTSHITAGMSIANVLILWHQGLFDEYGLRKLCYLREVLEKSLKFPEFSAKGKKVGEKVATACYIQKYLDNETFMPKECVR